MTEEESKPRPLINEYRDDKGRVTKREFSDNHGQLSYIDHFSYLGNRTEPDKLVRKDSQDNPMLSIEFIYDLASRKIAQTFKNPAGKITRTLNFEYGSDGNLKREVERVTGRPGYTETLYHPTGEKADIVIREGEDFEPEEMS